MSIKKAILSVILISLILATACSKQVYIDKDNNKKLNYNFIIANIKNIDKTLAKQKYLYTTEYNKRAIAVISYKAYKAAVNQYLVDNKGTLDINVPKDSSFIVSLPANRIITYSWNIKNSLDNGIIKLDNKSWMEIPMPISERGKKGENFDRQNFYFTPITPGNEQIVLRYEHQEFPEREFLEITLNVKVE